MATDNLGTGTRQAEWWPVDPIYHGAAPVTSGKNWTIAGYVGSGHAYPAGGPMYVWAARADLNRGQIASTGDEAQQHAPPQHVEIRRKGEGVIT